MRHERVIQYVGARVRNDEQRGPASLMQEADLAIDRDGVVIKDRHGLVGRKATQAELASAWKIAP